MTVRYFAYTVTLEQPIRSDDAESIEHAIRMIKGVADVVPQVADAELFFAVQTARREIGQKLWEIIYPK